MVNHDDLSLIDVVRRSRDRLTNPNGADGVPPTPVRATRHTATAPTPRGDRRRRAVVLVVLVVRLASGRQARGFSRIS
ncbi:hypothetical protein GCM10023258_13890 [Terrabacter aeriphilus]|uniref:Uncharacterized protein n=1 Tax=Terrabacter aeriphilus TaxID=515662 RepID=A0ABP9J7D3_9MICO